MATALGSAMAHPEGATAGRVLWNAAYYLSTSVICGGFFGGAIIFSLVVTVPVVEFGAYVTKNKIGREWNVHRSCARLVMATPSTALHGGGNVCALGYGRLI